MRFENPELETTFEVPEPMPGRLSLRYDSIVELNIDKAEMFERLWGGVKAVAQNWQSPHAALDIDLNEPLSPKARQAIKWAGLALFGHMQELKTVPLA